MKIKAILPKMGNTSDYIGKSFIDLSGKSIGVVTNCIEKNNMFELEIDGELPEDINKPVSFSISYKE